MIKSNELRLGNWVTETFLKRQFYVISIGEFYLKAGGNGSSLDSTFDNFNPLPLTPEILEKCGFKRNSFISREFNKNGDYDFQAVYHYEDGYMIICNFMKGGIYTKYLHQLQNLYFALTGEELKINL